MDAAWIGERLFGRPARLRIALWILEHDSGVFYQAEAVAGTGLPQSNVKEELERLVPLRMVTLAPRDKGSRRQYYVREDSPLWAVFEAVKQALEAVRADVDRTSGQSPGLAQDDAPDRQAPDT